MRIGVPREIKDGERRVGLSPDGAIRLAAAGHRVQIERGAGEAVGFGDDAYRAAGAMLVDADGAFDAELVVKVKELQPAEFARLRPRSIVFGFAQLNRDRVLTDAARGARITIVGYETVTDAAGALPLLAPMSRIAGKLAPLVGAMALSVPAGGAGVLLPGVDDVAPARVVVLGAGNVGAEAAIVAARIGCTVDVFSRGEPRRRALAERLRGFPDAHVHPIDAGRLADAVRDADLVVGGVLEPGTLSPKLLSRSQVASMRTGSAIVDVGIDQGGIAETSRMTKLSEPTYVEEGVVHYAVPNMPSLVARTATLALTAATLPYVERIASQGLRAAIAADPGLAGGTMLLEGAVVHPGLARDLRLELDDIRALLALK